MKQATFFLLIIFSVLATACGTTKRTGAYGSPSVEQTLFTDDMFKVTEQSTDRSYGYTVQSPIMVGGSSTNEGPRNERRFLNAITGPNGEEITYRRLGSCCGFKTENSAFGTGMLDMYEITYEGLKNPIILYINMYDSNTLKAPVGFKPRQFKGYSVPTV